MSKINEVMTATEAAERWGIAKVTVRQARRGRLRWKVCRESLENLNNNTIQTTSNSNRRSI